MRVYWGNGKRTDAYSTMARTYVAVRTAYRYARVEGKVKGYYFSRTRMRVSLSKSARYAIADKRV